MFHRRKVSRLSIALTAERILISFGAQLTPNAGLVGYIKSIVCILVGALTAIKIQSGVNDNLVYPDATQAPPPNPDLPEDIRSDYEEASSIIGKSPRGAAALLRLCIQKLCKHLGESGKNINNDIAALVKKGLNPSIQKSLDIVRVIGNEAVHPGTIDLKDNSEIAVALCKLVNVIADAMITQPKMIEGLYSSLPHEKKQQIEERDK